MSNVSRRVVVTGMCVVSPLGCDIDRFWSRLIAGQSGVGLIHNFDASSLPVRIAAEVRDFDPLEYMDRRTQRRMDPFAQYAVAAAIMANDHSGLDVSKEPERVGAVVATGVGGLGLLLALSALKPLVTVLCLGSGASGGLFTPTLSTGAVLGGALGIAWNLAWPGSPAGAFAMIGAAAMIVAAMQAPITALALVLELTHSGFGLMVPMLAATVTASGRSDRFARSP